MRVGETGEIQALLSVSIAGEQLMAELTAAGKRESDTLLVSDHMQATLAGGGAFDVSPSGPQSQWVSQSETTRWHWDVTPKLTGPQVLTLTLDAILTINGDKDTRNITTLTRQIDVRVSRPHGVGEWFARIKDIIEAIGWGWGVIVAVAGVLIKFRRRLRDWVRERVSCRILRRRMWIGIDHCWTSERRLVVVGDARSGKGAGPGAPLTRQHPGDPH